MASPVWASECGQIRIEVLFHWLVLPIPGHSRLLSALVMRIFLKCSQSVSPVICHSGRQGMTFPCKDTWGWHPTASIYVSALQTVQVFLEICLYFLVSSFFSSAFIFSFLFVCFSAIPPGMWDLSSPTRDKTCAPYTGSVESQPLHCQESPSPAFKLPLYLRENSISLYGNW